MPPPFLFFTLLFFHQVKNTVPSAPSHQPAIDQRTRKLVTGLLCYEDSGFPILPADFGGQVNGESLSFRFIDSQISATLRYRVQRISESNVGYICTFSTVLLFNGSVLCRFIRRDIEDNDISVIAKRNFIICIGVPKFQQYLKEIVLLENIQRNNVAFDLRIRNQVFFFYWISFRLNPKDYSKKDFG